MAKYVHILDRSAQAERKAKAFAPGKHKHFHQKVMAITCKKEENEVNVESEGGTDDVHIKM